MSNDARLDRRRALAGLTVAAGALIARPARAVLVAPDDTRLAADYIEYPGATGAIRAYLVRPAQVADQLPAVIVVHEKDKAKNELASVPVPLVAPDAWRRVALGVKGRTVEVFVDDKRVLTTEVKTREHLAGGVGIAHMRGLTEIRRWRFGVRK